MLSYCVWNTSPSRTVNLSGVNIYENWQNNFHKLQNTLRQEELMKRTEIKRIFQLQRIMWSVAWVVIKAQRYIRGNKSYVRENRTIRMVEVFLMHLSSCQGFLIKYVKALPYSILNVFSGVTNALIIEHFISFYLYNFYKFAVKLELIYCSAININTVWSDSDTL